MENIRDWCISRQLWWGQQLPIWYCGLSGLSELQKKMNPDLLEENKDSKGCGEIYVGLEPPSKCPKCGNTHFIRDPDTFDTWFSSGQWPYSTLGYPDKKDYQYFYPTSVMETGYDILFFWVARMMMLGLYRTDQVPFRTVYLHGMVRDVFGSPMSKSRPETCVDPTETVKKYGADALRMALVYGTSAGNDVVVGEDKIKGMRNFTNKIWNSARFIYFIAEKENWKIDPSKKVEHRDDKEIIDKLEQIIRTVNKDFDEYRFGQALEEIYQFFWHEFCDVYIEKVKDRRAEALPTLVKVLITSLKLLHPFAPFVTEAVYQLFREKLVAKENLPLLAAEHLIVSSWPTV
jgi:valyl-tRNA synthetase